MTGLEYTDRLIEDLNKTAETRAKVPDPFTQVKLVGLTGQTNVKDLWSALNIWEADAHLDIVSQFINIGDRLVDHDKGNQVDIIVWQRDITANRESIGEVFQQTLDNDQIIDLTTGTPIREFLIMQLDYIHQAAN